MCLRTSCHSTIQAATTLLEVSIAGGLEEQKRACRSVFKRLWQDLVNGHTNITDAAQPAVVISLPVGLRDIPSGADGDRFLQLWQQELRLELILRDLEE